MRRRGALLVPAVLASGCLVPLPECTDGECGQLPAFPSDDTATGGDDDDASGPGESTGGDTTEVPGAMCGNGVIEADETCDDGDDIDGDGCNADCQPSLRVLDQIVFDGGYLERDIGRGIGVDPDGDIVVVGTFGILGLDTAFVRGFDPGLADRFSDTLGAMDLPSHARGVAVNASGFAAVIGNVGDLGDSDVLITFHDPTGERTWTNIVPGVDGLGDQGTAILFDPFGQLYAISSTERTSGDTAVWLLRYSANGSSLGDTVLDSPPGVDIGPRAIDYAPPSSLVMAGYEATATTTEIIVSTIDLDPFGGATVHAGNPMAGAEASGVALDGGGNVVAVGIDSDRAWVAQYSPELALVWMYAFDDAAPSELFDLVVIPEDDSIYVVGQIDGTSGDNDVLAAHFSSTGGELARAQHDLGGGHDSARAVARAPDGTLLVTGEAETAMGFDAFVLRLST